jgi:phage terminase large subunit-like protein
MRSRVIPSGRSPISAKKVAKSFQRGSTVIPRPPYRAHRSLFGFRQRFMEPFTVQHFEKYASLVVFDDGSRRGLEDWQLQLAEDLFRGFKRNLWIIPEGNGKSTLVALLALYGADYSDSPWIPIGAAAAKQARIIHDQATGFVERTPGMNDRFRSFGGYRLIRSLRNGGIGIEVFAHDPKTGDGVIPYPYALLDELHRHPDMRLWDLWAGKLRKRDAQILGISTGGEPETPFETMRDDIRRRAKKRDRMTGRISARRRPARFCMSGWSRRPICARTWRR